MKVFQLTQADLDRLTLMVDHAPKRTQYRGRDKAYDDAQAFFVYQIRKWITEVSK